MSVEIVGTHPYADKFPMLSDPELDELAESIATVGLLHPIIVDSAGLILDGRNRLEACNRAQVEARIEVYAGADVAEYVIACNVTRRNMSIGARAMATALVLDADGRRENCRWQYGGVTEKLTQLNSDSSFRVQLSWAGTVLDFRSDLTESVLVGNTSLKEAYGLAKAVKESAERDKILKREKAKREKAEAAADAHRNAEIVADLTQSGATNYIQLINSGTMTPKAAWAAYREDTRKERERLAQEREVLRDRYTSIAKTCLTASSWGGYAPDAFQNFMEQYDPELLNPPQLDKYLTVESLTEVAQFAEQLLIWRSNYES